MEVISVLAVTIATIVSLIYYKKFKDTPYVYFIYFMVFTFLTEFFGILFGHILLIYNVFVYNIYTIFVFIFYFVFYKKIFKNSKNKKIMLWFVTIYLLFVFADIFIIKTHFFNHSLINSFVVGAVLLLVTLILFLKEVIDNKNAIFNIRKTFIFWISTGALLFFIGVIPVMITVEHFKYEGLPDYVIAILNVIMYGCFVIGFVNSDHKYNY